jgi:hypothetical protein
MRNAECGVRSAELKEKGLFRSGRDETLSL